MVKLELYHYNCFKDHSIEKLKCFLCNNILINYYNLDDTRTIWKKLVGGMYDLSPIPSFFIVNEYIPLRVGMIPSYTINIKFIIFHKMIIY